MTIDFLKNVLWGAGNILLDRFGTIGEINTKQDQSNVVTISDFESEEFIRSKIIEKYPEHNILGEEKGFEDSGSDYSWIIDPLDGTSNYAAGLPWFGVLIALLKNQTPVLAGAFLPSTDELYFATKGGGAYKNDQSIQVSNEIDLKNLLCCYSLDFSVDIEKTEQESRIIKDLAQNCRNIRSTNCLLDFCFTAEGKIGCAINQTMKIWDIAAPQLIIEEAGGKITDIDGGPIKYIPSVSSLTHNYTAVAANGKIHEQVMHLIHLNK